MSILTIWTAAAAILALWAIWLTGAMTMAVTRWGQARARLASSSEPTPTPLPVILLRPCTGHPPFLEETLRSTGDARCVAPLRIRFSVADEGDLAYPLCQQIAEELRAAGRDAAVVVLPPAGPNHKAGQVAAALESQVPADAILLVADGDVDFTGLDLDALLAPLHRDPAAGVVWMPPVERGTPVTWGDRAAGALLSGSLHAFPLLAGLDPAGLVGKLFAVHPRARPALEPVHDLGWFLGEDMEIARRVRAAGLHIVLHPEVAVSRAAGRPLGAVIQRFARWFLVIRAQRPLLLLSYPLFFGATLPILLGAGVIAAWGEPVARIIAGVAVATALLSRAHLAYRVRRITGAPARPLGAVTDVALAELILWLALGRTLLRREVPWAGRRLRVGASGRLIESPEPHRG